MPQTGDREAQARVIKDVIDTLEDALAKLDRIEAPADIGAHVDRAVCRLREINGSQGPHL